MDKLLEVKDLFVSYRSSDETVRAVNGIGFELGKGETLGIVGETGAGKTTTVLSILKLLPRFSAKIDKGSIEFDGIDLASSTEITMREIRGKKISMIFQDPMTSLNPVMTVGEQISEVLYLHRYGPKSVVERRVDEILTLVGIPPSRKHEYPHQFSGGMKQRVVIAMALASEPDLLIADEPTTALDVTIQAQVLDMMGDLQRRLKTAMIFISHDLGIIVGLCDNVAIMYAGEFVEYGTVFDVFDPMKFHHPYTTGLFGSIPNLTKKTRRLTPIEGLMPNPEDLPSGCRFHPRCPHCMERCRTGEIPNHVEGVHKVKCLLYAEREDDHG
jgi:peptide/nickel transport system ATP-binding protein